MNRSNGWKRLEAGFLGILALALILSGCARTQHVLTREPAPAPPTLEGRWDLVGYGPAGAEAPVLPDSQVFVVFAPDGTISGSGGCNRYFGGWGFMEGQTDVLRIWRTGSTKMACAVPVMTQEHRFLEELSRVSTYATDGKALRLFYDGGKGVLRFSRGAP